MSFDRISSLYPTMERWMAGPCMHKARVACLNELHEPKNVLLVGEGHGRLLIEMLRRFPDAQMTCLDSSAGMLENAKRAMIKAGFSEERCHFIHADALSWQPDEPARFDLITSCFFFDCFPQSDLERMIRHLSQAAKAQAQWLVADFQIPRSGMARWRGFVIVKLLYLFFRLATGIKATELPQHSSLMRHAGFALATQKELEFGLLFSELWQRDTALPQFKEGSSGIRASSL